jgi:PIN domain nuclease of toxin-antitoxin system
VSAPRGRGLLLDTSTFIWWATRDPRLTVRARAAIARPDTPVFLSVVTPWEMTIKHALGRLELAGPPRSVVYAQIAQHGYEPLDVTLEHVLSVGELPPHHGDPFDRLLIVQARAERLTLVSGDAIFERYDVPVLW